MEGDENAGMGKIKLLWKNASIRHKVLVPVLTIIVVFVSLVYLVIYNNNRDVIIHNSKVQSTLTAEQTRQYFEQVIDTIMFQFYYLEMDEEFRDFCNNRSPGIEDEILMQKRFRQVCETSFGYIGNVFLYHEQSGKLYYDTIHMLLEQGSPTESSWYRFAKENPNSVKWESVDSGKMFSNSSENAARIIKYIADESGKKDAAEPVVLVFELNTNNLFEIVSGLDVFSSGNMFILDEEGRSIFRLSEEEKEQAKHIFAAYADADEGVTETSDHLLVHSRITANDWNIFYLINKDEIADIIDPSLFVIIMIALVSALFVIFIKFFMKWLLNPIDELISLLKEVEQGNFQVAFSPCYNDEIGALGSAFNKMTRNIYDLFQKLEYADLLQMRTELKVLQEQINSHFLYNTLNAIYWEALSGDRNNAAEIVLSLSNFFRLSLNNGKYIATIRHEAELLEKYIGIITMCNKDKFTFDIDIKEELYDIQIPKLILQPLVENSIEHGFRDKKRGSVFVKVYRKDGLVFEVTDDGGNMDVEQIQNIIKNNSSKISGKMLKTGNALVNIHNRIKSYWGDRARMEFHCEKGVCSTVTITINEYELPELD